MNDRDRVLTYYERWTGLTCVAIAQRLHLDEAFVCGVVGYPPPRLVSLAKPQTLQSIERCPRCESSAIKKNGAHRGRQIRACKHCGRSFIERLETGGITITGTGILSQPL